MVSSGGKGWCKHAKELCNGEAELRARGIKLSCYGGDKIDQRIEMVGDEQEGKKRKGSYGLSLSRRGRCFWACQQLVSIATTSKCVARHEEAA